MNQVQPTNPQPELNTLVEAICALPNDFHDAGVMAPVVLRMMARLMRDMEIQHSAETGSGKTTLLFSHLSAHHTVFAKDMYGTVSVRSISSVQDSNLFNQESTHFVVGSTQQTLPQYEFTQPLDVVLIDGPHGYPFPEMEYYYFYPQLREGGILFLDDIHIPTIWRLFEFLLEEEMFELIEVTGYTAAFRRTGVKCFDPYGDGWWLQAYNARRKPEAKARADEALAAMRQQGEIAGETDSSRNANYYIYQVIATLLGATFARRLRNAYRAFKAQP